MRAVAERSRVRWVRRGSASTGSPVQPSGLAWLLTSEAFSGAIGFLVLAVQARRLGPAGFAEFEYAAAIAAWMLVVVRGGVDVIVYREAARRPRLIARLTDLLIGIRLAASVVGYAIVLLFAVSAGAERGLPVAVAGAVLLVSACTADVGLRAEGRLRWLAAAQSVRALAYFAAVCWLVGGSGDATRAACALVAAELLAAAVTLAPHSVLYRTPRPRFRRRAWSVLLRRGAIAGLMRFGRVSLYGADMLVLGAWVGPELGPYAAGRRVVFAFAALGLVIPSVLGPAIARAWAAGSDEARDLVGKALEGLLALAIPAALGLALTADRWTPLLFGSAYHGAGPWLALVAARLPWLIAASFEQSVLVACRRELWALGHVLAMLGLASVLIPTGLATAGPWGVAWAVIAFEGVGAFLGWVMSRHLQVARGIAIHPARIAAGCAGLVVACHGMREAPVALTSLSGALMYGIIGWAFPGCRSVAAMARGEDR